MDRKNPVVVRMKQYATNKKIKEMLNRINPLLAKDESNIRIHLEALVNNLITEEEYKVIETKMALGKLCLEIEKLIPDGYVTMLFYSKEDNKIFHGAAPNFPVEFFDFFYEINDNGLFGENCGSCGRAVFQKQDVFTDITTSPLWAPFRDYFLKWGFQTGWSIPFFKNNEVVGTFAIYHKYPRHISKEEVWLVKQKIKDYQDAIFNMAYQLVEKKAQ